MVGCFVRSDCRERAEGELVERVIRQCDNPAEEGKEEELELESDGDNHAANSEGEQKVEDTSQNSHIKHAGLTDKQFQISRPSTGTRDRYRTN